MSALVDDVVAQLEAIPDPELPFLTIKDLGILRGHLLHPPLARVQICPTYSGCPALDTIRADVEKVLRDNGFTDVEVETVLSPAWTTDWLSECGRAAMAEHGLAPPGASHPPTVVVSSAGLAATLRQNLPSSGGGEPLACPQCGSRDTEELSRFGATACKALHRCKECREPFEHLKAH